jgi:hypothetical protein
MGDASLSCLATDTFIDDLHGPVPDSALQFAVAEIHVTYLGAGKILPVRRIDSGAPISNTHNTHFATVA